MHHSKRTALIAILLMLCMLFSACGGEGEPSASPEPTGAEAGYTMMTNIRYWPEDADYDTCDYALIVDVPRFSQTDTYGFAKNVAVGEYRDALAERVETEYMPISVTKPPYTQVSCEVETVDGVTNIVFSEEHCYEVQPIKRTYVLMLDEKGRTINLCDLLLNYHAAELVSSALEVKLDGRCSASELFSLIDINHGIRSRESGFTVFIPQGSIVPFEEGELAFDIAYDDAAPDFVGAGKALSLEEYRSLTEFLGFVTDALIVRTEDIENGSLSDYAATSFMGELTQTLGLTPEAGRISVPEKEFNDLYSACFGTDFPGIDRDAHDITLENGVYSIRAKQKEFRYNVDMLEVVREGDSLIVDGDLIFGDFGYAYSDFVCHARIKLHKNTASPYGFTVDEFSTGL